MKIWLNRSISNEETCWSLNSKGHYLVLVNKIGMYGTCFEECSLGWKRVGKTSFIFINEPRKRPSVKTFGVFISEVDYEVFDPKDEVFTAPRRKIKHKGRFGVYNIGTIIKEADLFYELTEEHGWEVRDTFDWDIMSLED